MTCGFSIARFDFVVSLHSPPAVQSNREFVAELFLKAKVQQSEYYEQTLLVSVRKEMQKLTDRAAETDL